MRTLAAVATWLVTTGCTDVALKPPPDVVQARFDPTARVIPMPSDILRDAAHDHLLLPIHTPADLAQLTPAENEFYTFLETLDGWSSLMSATVQFTRAIDLTTVGAGTVQVWHWGGSVAVPEQVTDVRFELSADGKQLQIDPPEAGWQRGERYVAMVRGGAGGVTGASGEPLTCDAAFYFLRLTEPLDTPAHEYAFPGATHEQRMAEAHQLEQIREDYAPMFAFFEQNGIARDEVAALWDFTVTAHTELAMDQPSQRLPLPIDLMIDPATGHVSAPAVPWDTPLEAEAKTRLADFDGMSLSGSQLFEFTTAMDASTLTASSVQLYQVTPTGPVLVPATVALLPDQTHLEVTPTAGRLAERTTYALAITTDVRDATGALPALMPIGHFLRAHAPLVDGSGTSQISAVTDADARRLEISRTELAGTLDALGRSNLLAAWPFTTMSVAAPLATLRQTAATLSAPADPANIQHLTPAQALADFPFGIGSVLNVSDVYYGTISSPFFLDPTTRAWRDDGGYDMQDVHFAMTIPKNAASPMPVVIFGHGLVCERRFVLAIGDALAAQGFASISIDFPYHGERTYCATGGPVSVVDPLDGSLVSLNPCQAGTTCNAQGRCVDGNGNGNALATWGVISTPVASGAVFLELDHIANSKDHFGQALVDLGALDRSLRLGAWQAAIGHAIDPTRIYYAGQSLGGIMGALFLGTAPDVPRAVLNVPGAGLVPMFDNSTFFSAQMSAFFQRQNIDRASFDGQRFLVVAHWFMDAVDPQHLGPITGNRVLLIQRALLDEIIPAANTELLEQVTGAPSKDYLGEHGFLVIPAEPAYWTGTADLASFLAGQP